MRVERKPKSADRIARDAQCTSYHVEHEAFRIWCRVHDDQSGHELVVDNESRRAIVGSIYAVNKECIIEQKPIVEPGWTKESAHSRLAMVSARFPSCSSAPVLCSDEDRGMSMLSATNLYRYCRVLSTGDRRTVQGATNQHNHRLKSHSP